MEPTSQGEVTKLNQVIQIDEGRLCTPGLPQAPESRMLPAGDARGGLCEFIDMILVGPC